MDDNLFGSTGSLVSNDTILPSQFYPHNEASKTPMGRLMIAVLEDALRWLQRRPDSAGGREARLWIDQPQDGPFTFDGVCDYLGIEPGYLRKGLERWDGARLARRSAVNGAGGARPTVTTERASNNKRRYITPVSQ